MQTELRVDPKHGVRLADRDAGDRFGIDKIQGEQRLAELVQQLSILQNHLWAEKRRSVLLVLQGIDASGKDGTIRRVFTGLNPQGCSVTSFRAPAGEEAEHDYLWRVHHALPRHGEIGIFNRSHYEDVVTTTVLGIIDDRTRQRRYRQIREFERALTEEGTRLVKVFLHVSKDEQRRRLRQRLADSEKRWKFRLDDLEARGHWDEYMTLYEKALSETSTTWAPWYVVPADHKWAAGLAVATLLVDTLAGMNPAVPASDPALDGVVVD